MGFADLLSAEDGACQTVSARTSLVGQERRTARPPRGPLGRESAKQLKSDVHGGCGE